VGLSGALAPPAPITPTAAAPAEAVVRFDVTPQVPAGGTVSISLKNESGLTVKGSIDYDPSKLAPGQPMAGVSPGSYPIEMSPRGDKVVVLRALPAANGQVLNISISGLTASGLNGETASVRLDGTGLLTVDAPR
jgi:general secretion pathway protein D